MKHKQGFFMLVQAVLLSIMLLAAAALFSIFRLYAQNQYAENARMTAAYLAQKEIALIEGELLTQKGYAASKDKENTIQKNNTYFTAKTVLTSENDLKKISTHISWLINGRQEDFSLSKTVYIYEEKKQTQK